MWESIQKKVSMNNLFSTKKIFQSNLKILVFASSPTEVVLVDGLDDLIVGESESNQCKKEKELHFCSD